MLNMIAPHRNRIFLPLHGQKKNKNSGKRDSNLQTLLFVLVVTTNGLRTLLMVFETPSTSFWVFEKTT
jgi:peptidoglycan biosynthesis protein MviN/MurJ (putative lipid II flippase)